MMNIKALGPALCRQYSFADTHNGVIVTTPFTYDDGDSVVVFVSSADGAFIIHDNGEAAFRLMTDGIDLDQRRVVAWLEHVGDVYAVKWNDEDDQLECIVRQTADLPQAITRIAEASIQMQALIALRVDRSLSDFKDEVIQVLKEIEAETGITAKYNVAVDPDHQLIADAYFLSKQPLTVVVANTQARLLEAELMWASARYRKEPMRVIAVVESAKKIGLKEFNRANYFTDKTVAYAGMNQMFRNLMLDSVAIAD